jgi:hypothetical protein
VEKELGLREEHKVENDDSSTNRKKRCALVPGKSSPGCLECRENGVQESWNEPKQYRSDEN